MRSLCTTVCKWTYLGHEGRGGALGRELLPRDRAAGARRRRLRAHRHARAPDGRARSAGSRARAAARARARAGHAGGRLDHRRARRRARPARRPSSTATPRAEALEQRLALIGGHLELPHGGLARRRSSSPGIWGPYCSAMVPGMWLTEGGQSATGALIDHVDRRRTRAAAELADAGAARRHERLRAPQRAARRSSRDASARFPAELTRELHVLPDHHGNRSPRADPTLRGMVSGLKLTRHARRARAALPRHGAGHRPRHAPHHRRHERARATASTR